MVNAPAQHKCRSCGKLHDPKTGIICPACWTLVSPLEQRAWKYARRRFDNGQITTRQLATAAEAVAKAARAAKEKIAEQPS